MARESRGPVVVAVCSQDRAGCLGKKTGNDMSADPAEPVGGIARIGFATMADAVPVGGEPVFTKVIGGLGGLVARIPEVVDLEQARRQGQPGRSAGARQERRQRRLFERGPEPGTRAALAG